MTGNSQTNDNKPLAPGLYIVATPIGNLGDITLRALDALKQADVIACEDTRVTKKLLNHYGITARTVSYHEHNEDNKQHELLGLLQAGKKVALVSDAGTPLISDPGYKLVRAAVAEGVTVVPIPGASSVITALCASGMATDRFLYAGFLPAKAGARDKAIAQLATVDATLIVFESVHRLPESLAALAKGLGARDAVVARELTKLYEEFRRGTLEELAAHYAKTGDPKGEVVLVIAPPLPLTQEIDPDDMLREALKTLSVKDAAGEVAKVTGLARQALYSRALKLKG